MEREFWLTNDDGRTWVQVDKKTWVAAERGAGFHNTMGRPEEPATHSFGGRGVCGQQSRPDPGPGIRLVGFDYVEPSLPVRIIKIRSNRKGTGHYELWDHEKILFCGMGAHGVQSRYTLTDAEACQHLHDLTGFTY